jgi:4-alpha-glucanotransferase
VVRVDHFRGWVAYWEVPASEKTAMNGKWIPVPGEDFLKTLMKHFACLPIIAEDLGTITPDVREIISRYGLPGMRLLLFAFGEDFPNGAFLPHNHVRHCIIYTGTHDNNTAKGWFETEASAQEKERLYRYLGRRVSANEMPGEMIRMAMMSVANTAILPMQDLLGLGVGARMNNPAKTKGNCYWRMDTDSITKEMTDRLREMTETYGRS